MSKVLRKNKSEIIMFGPLTSMQMLNKHPSFLSTNVKLPAKILGVIFDIDLTFEKYAQLCY